MGTVRTNRITCAKLDDFGQGICYLDGRTVFVPNLLPGEVAEIKTIFDFGKLKKLEVTKLLTRSADRVDARCPFFETCGGCTLQHLKYEKQLEYKRQKIKDNIHKFGKLDVEVSPTIGLEDPWNFRNKVQVPLGMKDKKLVAGFYQEKSHKLVPNDYCLIESSIASKIRKDVLEVLNAFKVEAYNEDKMTGVFRHILIKVSETYNEVMVVLVTATEQLYGASNIVKAIAKKDDRIKTICQNINPLKTNVILGPKTRVLYGPGKIKDRLCDMDFLISAKSFYQTNFKMNETLYNIALELADISSSDRVLDAYCGTGTIGLVAARRAKSVVGVELEHSAVLDARLNKKINNIENIEFIEADCTEYVVQNNESDLFDIVIMDPPRAGSTERFIKAIESIKPSKIVYISCDPATLGRDLGFFSEYEVIKIIPVDMFSHSYHVETVCLLSKLPADHRSEVNLEKI